MIPQAHQGPGVHHWNWSYSRATNIDLGWRWLNQFFPVVKTNEDFPRCSSTSGSEGQLDHTASVARLCWLPDITGSPDPLVSRWLHWSGPKKIRWHTEALKVHGGIPLDDPEMSFDKVTPKQGSVNETNDLTTPERLGPLVLSPRRDIIICGQGRANTAIQDDNHSQTSKMERIQQYPPSARQWILRS